MSESTGYTVSTTLKANTLKFKSEIEAAIKKIEKFDKIVSKIDDIHLKVNDKLLKFKLSKAEQAVKRFEKGKHVVRIDSNIQNALTKVSQLENIYNVIDSKKIVSILDLKDNLAKSKLTNFTQSFNNLENKIVKPTIALENIEANSKINKFNFNLNQIDDRKVDTEVIAKTKEAINKLEQYKTLTNALGNERINTIIDLSDKLFLTKVLNANQALKNLNGREAKTRVEVETAASIAKVSIFKKVLKSIPNKIKIKTETKSDTNIFSKSLDIVNSRVELFNKRMDRIASSIRTFGTIGGSVVKGILITSFSALIPIVASIIPLIALVGNSIAIIGGGALGLVGAFGVAGTGAIAFGLMAKTALNMLDKGLIETSASTNSYMNSLDELKNTWEGIIKINANAIFNAMSNGIKGATSAISQLKPFISGVSQSVESAMQKFQSWISVSYTAKNAFKALNTDGVAVFDSILSAAGKFGDGLVNILTQFSPLFTYVAKSLDTLAEKFQIWSTQVSTSEGIKNFINFVKTNLPIIGQIFLDVFTGIINIFKAFGSNSTSLLDTISTLASQFNTWSNNLAQSEGFKKFMDYINENGPKLASLVGNVALAFINFITAMAPIGSVVLSVLSSVASFVAKLFEAHPVVAQIIGVLVMFGGSLMSIVPALVSFITFIAPLISRFGFLKTALLLLSRGFTLLQGPINILKAAFSLLMGPIGMISRLLPILGSALTFLVSPIGLIIAAVVAFVGIIIYLWKTNETFRNKVIEVWNIIYNAILSA
ncbi:MAG: hypothetical protein E6867_06775, partial [Staphylococcus epidermidis]|nr:hypothetical protein [Staphylococcus epidermidis]